MRETRNEIGGPIADETECLKKLSRIGSNMFDTILKSKL